jgi:hypothetical protein
MYVVIRKKQNTERSGFEPEVPVSQDNRLAGGSVKPTPAPLLDFAQIIR